MTRTRLGSTVGMAVGKAVATAGTLAMMMSGAFLVAACGGGGGTTTPDAPVVPPIDAPPIDGPPPIDAPPPIGATVALHEVEFLSGNGTALTTIGKGGQVTITYARGGAPALEEMDKSTHPLPGFTLPCFASYGLKSAQNPPLDEGPVTFTITKAGGGAGTVMPACTFISAAVGYQCVASTGVGGTLTVASGDHSANQVTYTAASTSIDFDATNVGRYFLAAVSATEIVPFAITGASHDKLGLVQVGGTTLPPSLIGYTIAGGVGPVPYIANPDGTGLGASPEFLNEGDKVVVTYGAAGKDIAPYTSASAFASGGHPTLNTESQTVLSSPIDLSGNADVTLGISNGSGPGAAAGAGLLIVIDATDATDATALDLGTNNTYVGNLTCATLDTFVPIPKDLLKIIGHLPGLRNIRISIFRDNVDFGATTAQVVAGHGLIQFQRRTP
jgi:hypothetical protein